MYKVLFLLLLTTNIFSMDRESIARLQFENIEIEDSQIVRKSQHLLIKC